jgi:hypothetical protein
MIQCGGVGNGENKQNIKAARKRRGEVENFSYFREK